MRADLINVNYLHARCCFSPPCFKNNKSISQNDNRKKEIHCLLKSEYHEKEITVQIRIIRCRKINLKFIKIYRSSIKPTWLKLMKRTDSFVISPSSLLIFDIMCRENLRRKKIRMIHRVGLNWTLLPARFPRRKGSRSCSIWRCRDRRKRWTTTYMVRVSIIIWWGCVTRRRRSVSRFQRSSRTRLTQSLITSPSRRHRSVIKVNSSSASNSWHRCLSISRECMGVRKGG